MKFSGMLGAPGRLAWHPTSLVTLFTCALALPANAHAQAVGSGAPTRDELRGVTAQPPEQAPRLDVSGDIERSPCPLADPQFNDVRITVGSVTFNNLKGATADELAPAWRPFAGSEQPISVICEIRDAAATILRGKGYLAAVQVPVQRIENGNVVLEVLYARLTAVRARGETRGAERKLEQYLGGLAKDEIFDRRKAERYLLLARDLPGYNVRLTLKPAGTGVGDLIGEVSVVRQPYSVDLTLQNLATKATGRWGGQVRAQFFGLTGLGDVTSLSYYATADFKEQHILQALHEFRPGSEGLVVGANFTYAWTKPNLGANTPLDAKTLYASMHGRYPIRRSQASNLWVSAGLDYVAQNIDLAGAPLNRDRLTVAWARLDYDAIDTANVLPRWKLGASAEIRQGLDVFGATRSCIGVTCGNATPTTRFDGRPTATVVRFEGSAEVRIGTFSIVGRTRAQHAFRPLLSFEEFTAGNFTVGRGYDPGTLIGDDGIGLSGEIRAPRIALGKLEGARIQPFVFVDTAWVWNKDTSGSQNLTSLGGGVRSVLGDRFRLEATVAVPAKRAGLQARRGDTRFLLTLTSRILPWRTK